MGGGREGGRDVPHRVQSRPSRMCSLWKLYQLFVWVLGLPSITPSLPPSLPPYLLPGH